MDTKTQRQARACLEAMGGLTDSAIADLYSPRADEGLVPLRVLLDHVDELVNGKAEARDKKNAGDRKRRAKKKSPGKKARAKNPRAPKRATTISPAPVS